MEKLVEETYILGKQQCIDGIDEDDCEELEYNECEENEYRCQDGSCIPERYWLDGQYDCSDKSDEQAIRDYFKDRHFCPLTSSQFSCDEATAHHAYFACGDGEFRYEFTHDIQYRTYCYNYRDSMFFCEINTFFSGAKWTLANGHCVDKGWIEKNLTHMDDREKCVHYLKCILTNGTSVGCNDIIRYFHSLCKNATINYPSEPLFKPYAQTVYQLTDVTRQQLPDYVILNRSIKCIGYHARFRLQGVSLNWSEFISMYPFDTIFCDRSKLKEISGPQIDKNCWNDTKWSYRCQKNPRCISKHRLRDEDGDCGDREDEDSNQECYIKTKHRLNCSSGSPLCLLVPHVGDYTPQCIGGVDEFILQLQWNLLDHKCRAPNSIECSIVKAHIQSSSSVLTTENDKVLIFRQYCDTLWQLPRGFDESLCKEWKCPRDEYQCLSGHCILKKEMFKLGARHDWQCPDATDSIGFFGIPHLSKHNAELIDHSDLKNIEASLTKYLTDSDFVAFTRFCDYRKEYGCILGNVSDPLNFTINRPCINLTQIGDGIIDCYGGLDERNLLTCGNHLFEQRGFDFHCSDQECIPYHRLCEQRCSNNADALLCEQLETLWNLSRPYPTHADRCEIYGWLEYDFFETSPYYCDQSRRGK